MQTLKKLLTEITYAPNKVDKRKKITIELLLMTKRKHYSSMKAYLINLRIGNSIIP